MKKLSLLDKFLVFLNSLLAIISLISFLSYFISPYSLPFIPFISLSIPALIVLNFLFVLYWLIKLKRQILISVVVLLVGMQYVSRFYSFAEKKVILTNDISIMSYNVRMFNLYNWIEEKDIDKKIYEFIQQKNPDILCIQEFNPTAKIGFTYPYKFVQQAKNNRIFGYAIFSKYKIINSGALNFTNSGNNTIFVDIVKNSDTLRVYNVHLESLRINPNKENFKDEIDKKLQVRLEESFKKQVNQTNLIIEHQKNINHKSVICGDFNNTAFSWVYKQLKRGKNDAYTVAGQGFGKTYIYPFPLRIDFILPDKEIEINNFKTYKVDYSDHYPIMARLNF